MIDELIELLTGQYVAPLAVMALFPIAFEVAVVVLIVALRFGPVGEVRRSVVKDVSWGA